MFIMLEHTYFALIAIAAASVEASDTSCDPTNLANSPPCAVRVFMTMK